MMKAANRWILATVAVLALSASLLQSQVTDPTMMSTSILGTPTRLVISCKDVIQSMAWWTRVGFLPVPTPMSRPDSAITLSDGQLLITLTKEALPTPIIMYSTDKMKGLKDSLDKMEVPTTYDVQGPTYSEIRLVSPNGVHIAVRSREGEPIIPVTGDSNRICGKNTELSIGTGYLKREQTFWEKLGYNVKRSGKEPYHFALMTDGVHTIGFHENRDILQLTFTYFAENMGDRLDAIKAAGIAMEDEALTPEGRIGSAVLTSPEGQKIFLFQGNQ